MSRCFSLLCLGAIGLALAGCAHNHRVQGDAAKSENSEGVRVGIGGKEIAEGEKISVISRICKTVDKPRGGTMIDCNDEKIGEARVLKVLDQESAIVRPDAGIAMDTTMKVEKQ